MIHTKKFYYNPTATIERGMESFSDLGYSLAIPWNDISTNGWANMSSEPMKMWGTENRLLTKPDPEYFAPGDLIRSNIIPAINPNDPVYQFSRAEHTYTLW